MSESQRYASHYLKQLAGSAGDHGHVEMSESSQSGGVGLGTANSITSRYLIPASISSKKAVVSVDVHGPGRNDGNIGTRKKVSRRIKRKKQSNNSQRGGKCNVKKRKKRKSNSSLYKGGGIRAPNHYSKRKFGRFDNLRDIF